MNDITDHYYTCEQKKSGKETKPTEVLKEDIAVTTIKKTINVNVFGRMMDITMTLGLDLPGRNSLNRFADMDAKIHLVCVRESDNAFRYHTVIQCGDNWSVWSSYYSNLLVFPKEAK